MLVPSITLGTLGEIIGFKVKPGPGRMVKLPPGGLLKPGFGVRVNSGACIMGTTLNPPPGSVKITSMPPLP